jgi:hypothetical protein
MVSRMTWIVCAVILSCGTVPLRGLAQSPTAQSIVPNSGLYVGLGAGIDMSNFGQANDFARGTSFAAENGSVVANGYAQGNSSAQFGTQASFTPSVQIGYFNHFSGSAWM